MTFLFVSAHIYNLVTKCRSLTNSDDLGVWTSDNIKFASVNGYNDRTLSTGFL